MRLSPTYRASWRLILAAAVVVLASCGGDTASEEPAQTTTTSPAVETTVGEASTTTTAATAPIGSADGAAPSVFDFVPRPVAPVPAAQPASGATVADHIGAMFAGVAELVVSDERALTALWIEEFSFRAPRASPDLVLAAAGTAAGLNAEVFDLIDAYAGAGLQEAFGTAEDDYFAIRSEAASVLRDANTALYAIAAEALTLPDPIARECVAEALMDDPPDCDDLPAAERLLEDLDAVFEAVDLPDELDDFDDQIRGVVDLCELWTGVTAMLGADEALLLDLAVDDSILDARFLGRSECRYQAGLDEDPAWDPQPGIDAFRTLYAAVVETGAALDFDEVFYDEAEYEDYLPRLRETIAAHAEVVAAIAPSLVNQVREPRARLALTWMGIQAAREAWFQELLIAGEYDDESGDERLFADLAGCVRFPLEPGSFDQCSPEEAVQVALVFDADFNDYRIAFLGEVIEADEVDEVVGSCVLWESAIEAAPTDRGEAVQFQMDQTALEDLLLHGSC